MSSTWSSFQVHSDTKEQLKLLKEELKAESYSEVIDTLIKEHRVNKSVGEKG